MDHGRENDGPRSDEEVEELQESAKEMGVDDADERPPEEVVEEVRHAQADDGISPSEWEGEDGD